VDNKPTRRQVAGVALDIEKFFSGFQKPLVVLYQDFVAKFEIACNADRFFLRVIFDKSQGIKVAAAPILDKSRGLESVPSDEERKKNDCGDR